jgi:hypothetical protein
MAIPADAVRQVEQDLLMKAEVLAHYLRGLGTDDPAAAARILTAIIERLERSLQSDGGAHKSEAAGQGERRQPFLVTSRDEIEEFVLESLADSPRGLSVQDIVDRLEEAKLEIKRQTLVVRLHRMVAAGKVASRAHGHYMLSEAEHGRRRSS